jgi:diazepam-binding inhibitor (GABA receptor modulating acyl-CoA-binding protein)
MNFLTQSRNCDIYDEIPERDEHTKYDIETDYTILSSRFAKVANEAPKYIDQADQRTLLTMYGLYKQANEGDCNVPRPQGIFDFKGKKKWDAWNSCKGMSRREAMTKYVDTAEKFAANLRQ